MQTEIDLSDQEQECPGYDVCPVGMCGCRWLGLGEPWKDAGQDGTKRDIFPNVTPDSGTRDTEQWDGFGYAAAGCSKGEAVIFSDYKPLFKHRKKI